MYSIKIYNTLRKNCKTCGGSGEVEHRRYGWKKYTCPTCKGQGYTTTEEEKRVPLSHIKNLINDSSFD